MPKVEFGSTEDLAVRFEPFRDKSIQGAPIESGDIVTIAVKKPDTTVVTYNDVSTPAVTRDADTKIWELTIPVASYMQGEWQFRATSNNANTDPQWRVLWWGLGATEKLGTPAGASIAADIASVKTDTTNIAVDAANAAAAAVAADTKATDIQTKVNFIHKLKKNGARIIGNQEIFYDDDGSTPILRFDLFDENSQATSTRIFRRIPVP